MAKDHGRDEIVYGAIIGLLANAIKLLINYSLGRLEVTSYVFWRLSATPFLRTDQMFDPLALLIGAIADQVAAAIFGVAFLFFLGYVGIGYLWIKSIGFSMFGWLTLYGGFLERFIQEKLDQMPSGVLVTIIAHVFFGLALAVFTLILKPLHEPDNS